MESRKNVEAIILKTTIALALLLSFAVATDETKLVKEVCKKTPVPYNDCVQALYKDSRTKTVKDLRDLTLLSLDLAMANSSEAAGYVGGLADNSPPALKPILQWCSDFLQSSYRDFHSAVGDLMQDAMMANYDVFIAMDGPTNCRNQMKEANVSIPAVSVRCSYVEFFVHLCYTATDMLVRQKGSQFTKI